MMELTNSLQEEISKIQNEIKSEILNHQILISQQKLNPLDPELKKRISCIQRHIISLGDAQNHLIAQYRRERGVHNNPLTLNHSNNNNNNYYNNNNNSTNDNHNNNNHHRHHHHHHHHHHHSKERRHERKERNSVYRVSSSSLPERTIFMSKKERILLSQDLIKREYIERDKIMYMKKKAEKDGGGVKSVNKDGFIPKTYPPKRYCEESLQQTLASFSEETKIPDVPPPNDIYCVDVKSEPADMQMQMSEDADGEQEEVESPPAKRSKVTLQAAPRPSSPVTPRKRSQDAVSTSSEDSEDLPFTLSGAVTNRTEFMLSLGLVTNDVLTHLKKRRSRRQRDRQRASSSSSSLAYNIFHNNMWDLTVRRNRSKYMQSYDNEMKTQDSDKDNMDDRQTYGMSPHSTDSDDVKMRICFVCREAGDLIDCRLCCGSYHADCGPEGDFSICPSCRPVEDDIEIIAEKSPPHKESEEDNDRYINKTHTTYAERLREKQQLQQQNIAMKKELSTLEERAKRLSESVINQNNKIMKLNAMESRTRKSIKQLVEFIKFFQSSRPVSKPQPHQQRPQSRESSS